MSHDPRPPLPLPPSEPLAVPPGFAERLSRAGITTSAEALARVGDYLGRLLAMNAQVNLTAVTTPEAAWERHALDALTLVPLLEPIPSGARVVDVGSGGGVPGVPIAIARPDLHVTLVESIQKKAAFLTAVSAALGLANVEVRAVRAEDLAAGPSRGSFDVVTARAVSRLDKLAGFTVPLLRRGGRALLVKGERADEELAEAKRTLARLGAVHERTVQTPTGRVVILTRA